MTWEGWATTGSYSSSSESGRRWNKRPRKTQWTHSKHIFMIAAGISKRTLRICMFIGYLHSLHESPIRYSSGVMIVWANTTRVFAIVITCSSQWLHRSFEMTINYVYSSSVDLLYSRNTVLIFFAGTMTYSSANRLSWAPDTSVLLQHIGWSRWDWCDYWLTLLLWSPQSQRFKRLWYNRSSVQNRACDGIGICLTWAREIRVCSVATDWTLIRRYSLFWSRKRYG